eukprot:TRINITY_DN8926_c0_g1_i4.p2 TRINITY_DN8926_c0_g1~~TRINITY_DN8926_c0_g1_i4.p2  ORF type:complete len:184 (+),score=27.70 TRINITY_DN8926_c0_g1_i4:177-728(+)
MLRSLVGSEMCIRDRSTTDAISESLNDVMGSLAAAPRQSPRQPPCQTPEFPQEDADGLPRRASTNPRSRHRVMSLESRLERPKPPAENEEAARERLRLPEEAPQPDNGAMGLHGDETQCHDTVSQEVGEQKNEGQVTKWTPSCSRHPLVPPLKLNLLKTRGKKHPSRHPVPATVDPSSLGIIH